MFFIAIQWRGAAQEANLPSMGTQVDKSGRVLVLRYSRYPRICLYGICTIFSFSSGDGSTRESYRICERGIGARAGSQSAMLVSLSNRLITTVWESVIVSIHSVMVTPKNCFEALRSVIVKVPLSFSFTQDISFTSPKRARSSTYESRITFAPPRFSRNKNLLQGNLRKPNCFSASVNIAYLSLRASCNP